MVESLLDKFNKGYPLRNFSKVTNAKGQEMFLKNSCHVEDCEKTHLDIMLDTKTTCIDFMRWLEDIDYPIEVEDIYNKFVEMFGFKDE